MWITCSYVMARVEVRALFRIVAFLFLLCGSQVSDSRPQTRQQMPMHTDPSFGMNFGKQRRRIQEKGAIFIFSLKPQVMA